MSNSQAVILFTSSPKHEASHKRFDADDAANQSVLRGFLQHSVETLAQLSQTEDFDLVISTNSAHSITEAAPHLAAIPFQIIPQTGHSFGGRLDHTLSSVKQMGYDKIVIIGNDCPALTSSHIQAAFKSLDEQPVVIGPAKDGGFYLLGVSQYDSAFFKAIPWRTNQVLKQLKANLNELQICPKILEKLADADDLTTLHTIFIDFLKHTKSFLSLILRTIFFKTIFSKQILHSLSSVFQQSYKLIFQKSPPIFIS